MDFQTALPLRVLNQAAMLRQATLLGVSSVTVLTAIFLIDVHLLHQRPAMLPSAQSATVVVVTLCILAWVAVVRGWQYAPHLVMLVLAVLVGLAPNYLTRETPIFLLVAPAIAAVFGLRWLAIAVIVELLLVGMRFGGTFSLETMVSGATVLILLAIMRWLLGFYWDVNQRQADIVLLQANILRAVEQPVLVIQSGIVLFANDAAMMVFEMNVDSSVEVSGLFEDDVVIQNEILQVLQTGIRQTGEYYGKCQQSGKSFPARVVIEPIRDQSLSPVGVVIAVSDLSGQRATIQALHNTQHLWQIFASGSRDMMTMLDGSSNYLLVTDACQQLLGYHPEELIGTPARTFMHPDEYPSARDTFRRLFLGENLSVSNMYRMKRKDGSWVWVGSWSRRTVYNGVPVIVTISRDATAELSDSKSEYRNQGVVEVSRRIGSIVHDIRGSVTILKSTLAMLEEGVDESKKTSIEQARGQLSRIFAIASQLNRLTGNVESKPEMVSVNRVIIGLQVWLESWKSKNISVTMQLSAKSKVYVDPVHIERIITNIVSNSFDAMPDGGIVRIKTHDAVARSGIMLVVRDNGIGISSEHQKKVFEPGFSTKTESDLIGGSGSGMGLYIVRKLVEQNGGSVRLRSREGIGTVVLVFIPKR